MSINSLFYTSLLCKVASFFSLAVFFFSYFYDVETRVLLLTLGISHLSWIVGRGFYFYFERVVTQLALAKHTAAQNVLAELEKEENNRKPKISHPLFSEEEKEDK